MIEFADTLRLNMEKSLQEISSKEQSITQKAQKVILTLENLFNDLRQFVGTYNFKNEAEEILFFKSIKPKLFCHLIYHRKIYNIEINRPTGGLNTQELFLQNELKHIYDYFDRNKAFYNYYRSGNTQLDKSYFLRGQNDMTIHQETFYFERDPLFSTCCDFKMAKVMANEKLEVYLMAELYKLDHINDVVTSHLLFKERMTWTDLKIALIEIMYAIHTVKSINHGQVDLKEMAAYYGIAFNIDLGDIYHGFVEIRNRKGNRTLYLDKLRAKLIERMDEADNK